MAQFSFDPVAAASIGQVHKGRTMADASWRSRFSIQVCVAASTAISTMLFPCCASAVCCRGNWTSTRWWLKAKQQLRLETDYLHEQQQLLAYDAALLGFRHL